MNLPDIGTLVPHQGTMLLLDRLVQVDEEALCAEVTIGAATLFCDEQGVGAWVGIEYMAQAIAAHAGHGARLRGEPVKVGFLLGARRYEVRRPTFAIGSVLHVHVRRALQGENGLRSFDCRIDDIGAVPVATIATATVMVFQPDNVAQFMQTQLNRKHV